MATGFISILHLGQTIGKTSKTRARQAAQELAFFFLDRGYELRSFQRGKAACKKALQKELGLEENKDLVLAGVVSRLHQQKGLDALLRSAPEFLEKMQFVVLGAGDPGLTDAFGALAARHPKSFSFTSAFDEALAHRIYGGSDVFVMPSRFEPCGLSQMIAMRFGSLPVVTRTGGLKDTVFYNGEPKDSNGFAIDYTDDAQLKSVLGHIVSLYGWRENWNMMVRNAMRGDYSWTKSAEAYIKLLSIAAQRRSCNLARSLSGPGRRAADRPIPFCLF